jgi:hypothetical protein
MTNPAYLRRRAAAEYLRQHWASRVAKKRSPSWRVSVVAQHIVASAESPYTQRQISMNSRRSSSANRSGRLPNMESSDGWCPIPHSDSPR